MKALMSEMLRCTSWVNNNTECFVDDQQSQEDSFTRGQFACISVLLRILKVFQTVEEARYDQQHH